MKKRFIALLISITAILNGCENTTAQDVIDSYGEQAKEATKEVVKETAAEAASNIDRAIEDNETASKVKRGVTTAGEYAGDAYEYVTDEKTIQGSKEKIEGVTEDTTGFFSFMLNKLKEEWRDLITDLPRSPKEYTPSDENILDRLEDFSEYDFYGNYKNPYSESKGYDSSSEGTAYEQMKEALSRTVEKAKETGSNIKQYHDERHPVTEDNKSADNVTSYSATENISKSTQSSAENSSNEISDILLPNIPEYSEYPYCIINQNNPFFDETELTTMCFETYSPLDSLGRAGTAYACFGKETMPSEDRGSLGMFKPTGWNQAKYDILKDEENNPAGYVMCRMHLAMRALGGNDEIENLVSGSFYCNLNMEDIEMQALSYVSRTGHHLMYRVTPVFKGNELMCRGVLMEIQSVEDDEISFCIYVYNVAPGIAFDYATGKNSLSN